MTTALPYQIRPDGLLLAVRVTPRARADALEGVGLDAEGRALLRIRLRAPPAEGAANAALLAWTARSLGLPRAAVILAGGASSRRKLLHLAGDGAALAQRVHDWLEGKPGHDRSGPERSCPGSHRS